MSAVSAEENITLDDGTETVIGKVTPTTISDCSNIGIRPVITISKDTTVESGDGSILLPYIIK